eukprot:m.80545 g.80545  ORF g.80545 m.80545 type:complete len:586 (+) comp12766_c0_seq2:218-1975(+)
MGVPPELVVSTEDGVQELMCAICLALPEGPVVTPCHHVFCAGCLDEWLNGVSTGANDSCPACKTQIQTAHGGVSDLRVANPLAWRVLARIKVRCPLNHLGCSAVLEFSELQSHLKSSDEHRGVASSSNNDTKTSSAEANALALKDQGNAKFQARQFTDAVALYSQSISICPNIPSLWGNRAAAYLMLGQHTQCINDCNSALDLDPTFVKAYSRKAKALVELNLRRDAVDTLLKAHKIASEKDSDGAAVGIAQELSRVNTLVEQLENGIKLMENKKYNDANAIFTKLLKTSNATDIVLWTARASLMLGLCDYGLRLTLQVLRREKNNINAYVVRGIALYFSEQYTDATRLIKEALRLDPDYQEAKHWHKVIKGAKTKIDEITTLEQQRDFEHVKELITQLLRTEIPEKAPLYASLYARRGNANYRLELYDAALTDCAHAIYVKDDCKSAWLTKRLALHALGKHEEALKEMQGLMQGWGQNDNVIRHACQQAEFELRKSKRPDYYALLGCKRVATEGEIKNAYRIKAMSVHPDKHADKSEEERKRMEEEFKILGHALEILADRAKRKLYDEGYDREGLLKKLQDHHH